MQWAAGRAGWGRVGQIPDRGEAARHPGIGRVVDAHMVENAVRRIPQIRTVVDICRNLGLVVVGVEVAVDTGARPVGDQGGGGLLHIDEDLHTAFLADLEFALVFAHHIPALGLASGQTTGPTAALETAIF